MTGYIEPKVPTRFLARSHLRDRTGLFGRNQPGSCQQSTDKRPHTLSLLRTPLIQPARLVIQSEKVLTHLPTFRGPHYRSSPVFASHLSHRPPCSLSFSTSPCTTLLQCYIVITVNHSHGYIGSLPFPQNTCLKSSFLHATVLPVLEPQFCLLHSSFKPPTAHSVNPPTQYLLLPSLASLP